MELTRRRDASAFTDLFHASSTRPALRTLDGGAITHAELAAFVLGFDDSALVAAGVSRQQRVCCGLDSGLEMALMFCTVAAKGYVFAPLSRALARCEYEFEYEDLPAACLIVHENDVDGDMIAVAMKRGLPVIEARPRIGGLFVDLCLRQAGREMGRAFTQSATSASDVAMVLHTSGTTSKPKTVPLTHGNLSAGSQFIAQTLRLEPTDVCLNVMPLFHIHGLAVNLLATLVSGSSVILAPGLAQLGLEGFFDVLEKRRPTWYSAVPTMHQAIASFREDAAISRRETKEDSTSSIVLVRNCSAALLPTVARRLEKVFQGSTVLPTYAMSESMPICSNPRFGQPRKLESVGPAAGPQVFIVDAETSNEAVQGAEGEVCVFGPCVTAGYELRAGRPDPNTFVQVRALKCLRTGDKGFFDTDGHLHLVGRFKEVVNRGGEKFSPFPVEDALLSHAAVRQVVAFAAPHALLGEVMAVAVVCEAGRVTTLAELRSWATASGTVNARALPEVCVIVPEIPVGPTGKPARIGLAKRLGLDAEAVQSSQDAVFDVGPGTVGEARLRRVMLVQQRKPRACIEAGPDDEVKEEDAVEDMDSLSMMRGRTSHARAAPRASARHMQSHAYAICMFALLFNWCFDTSNSPNWLRRNTVSRGGYGDVSVAYTFLGSPSKVALPLFFAVAGFADEAHLNFEEGLAFFAVLVAVLFATMMAEARIMPLFYGWVFGGLRGDHDVHNWFLPTLLVVRASRVVAKRLRRRLQKWFDGANGFVDGRSPSEKRGASSARGAETPPRSRAADILPRIGWALCVFFYLLPSIARTPNLHVFGLYRISQYRNALWYYVAPPVMRLARSFEPSFGFFTSSKPESSARRCFYFNNARLRDVAALTVVSVRFVAAVLHARRVAPFREWCQGAVLPPADVAGRWALCVLSHCDGLCVRARPFAALTDVAMAVWATVLQITLVHFAPSARIFGLTRAGENTVTVYCFNWLFRPIALVVARRVIGGVDGASLLAFLPLLALYQAFLSAPVVPAGAWCASRLAEKCRAAACCARRAAAADDEEHLRLRDAEPDAADDATAFV